ncbi:MAG: 3-methyl-2-oxobutanoate hydroxymethyltransferase, partial [Longimicrobiales bacterium]
RVGVEEIRARKGGVPLVCLTAYTTPVARLLDPHCELLLVGDSLAMVLYGLETTRGVTLETMVAHGQAVMRGSSRACVIVDMPFGTYEDSPAQAVESARRIVDESGCQGVKLEGGVDVAETVAAIVAEGIPVFGHVGLLPQKVERRGGFRIQGKDDEGARAVLADAEAIAAAGVFAMVVEGTVEPVAREVTERVAVPTVGIGASPACDGQILVTDDMLGLFKDFTPKFVKRYGELGEATTAAVRAYAEDVRARRFPTDDHVYHVDGGTQS